MFNRFKARKFDNRISVCFSWSARKKFTEYSIDFFDKDAYAEFKLFLATTDLQERNKHLANAFNWNVASPYHAHDAIDHVFMIDLLYYCDFSVAHAVEEDESFTVVTVQKKCVICQEPKSVDADGYCQDCHDEIAERNVSNGCVDKDEVKKA